MFRRAETRFGFMLASVKLTSNARAFMTNTEKKALRSFEQGICQKNTRLSEDISQYYAAHEEKVHVGKSNYGVLSAWVLPGLRLNVKFIVIQKCCLLFLRGLWAKTLFR